MKIKIPIFDLKAERIISVEESYIVLKENCLNYHIDFLSETLRDPEDELLGFNEPTHKYVDSTIKKDSIISVDISYDGESNFYLVKLICYNDNLNIFTQTKGESFTLKAEIIEWLGWK